MSRYDCRGSEVRYQRQSLTRSPRISTIVSDCPFGTRGFKSHSRRIYLRNIENVVKCILVPSLCSPEIKTVYTPSSLISITRLKSA